VKPPWLAVATDVSQLAALYGEAARALGPTCYGEEQVRAWAGFATDKAAFADYILQARTWIHAHDEGLILGFCGIGAGGEVHSLYVRPGHHRQGLGKRMLIHALEQSRSEGVQRLEAWVTPLSRPVFLGVGFVLTRTVTEPYQGVMFERYRVELG
jgi:GNAT superfamily N-acetyltransferase